MELKLYRKEPVKTLFPLLIVPYGIETNSDIILCLGVGSFNRTLWN